MFPKPGLIIFSGMLSVSSYAASCPKHNLAKSETPYHASSGETIDGKSFSNSSGPCVVIDTGVTNVTITNSLFSNCLVGITTTGKPGVGASNIRITGNRFVNMGSGVNAVYARNVTVNYNEYVNVGFLPEDDNSNFVQFNSVVYDSAFPGENSISYNIGETIGTGSRGNGPEDTISIFSSSGTAKHPITIVGNFLRGRGRSRSGSGIMTGDFGGNHISVQGNTLVNAGNVGIGIAGGENIKVTDNIIFHSASSFHREVAVYVWDIPENGAVPCRNHTVQRNSSTWFDNHGNLASYPIWVANEPGQACGNISVQTSVATLSANGINSGDLLNKPLFNHLNPNYFSSCSKSSIPSIMLLLDE